MNLFKLILKIKGYDLVKAENKIAYLNKLSQEEFGLWQNKTKWEIFNFHYIGNNNYRSFIGNSIIKEWEDIPIMDKKSIQTTLEERLTNGFKINDVFISHTSGSSGTPFYFAKDKFSHALTWGTISFFYRLHRINLYKDKQARFYGLPVNILSVFKERLKDKIMKRYRLNVLDPSDKIQEVNLRKLERGNFKYINGYSRSLVVFAKFLINNSINLYSKTSPFKAVIVTSGILTEDDRTILNTAFKVPIINEYGASEIAVIAYEDSNFNWIVNEFETFIEIVDNEGKAVKNGVQGRILLTSLWNKAMPFIRYEIGDIGVISEKRDGKFRILESLIGRSNDYMILKDGNKFSITILEHAIKPVINKNYDLKEYLIRQWDYSKFTFEYVSNSIINENIQEKVIKSLELSLKIKVDFQFIKLDKINRTSGWKLKYFERMF